jgi:hypothetical protein
MKIKITLFVFYLTYQVMTAMAMDAYFQPMATHSSGASNIQYQQGGTYLYSPLKDHRPMTQPIVLERSKRIDYELFTAEEEKALMDMRDKQLRSQIREEQIRQRKAFMASVHRIDWPKVIRRGNEICVPVLASSEAVDWKDHLTCYIDTRGDQ